MKQLILCGLFLLSSLVGFSQSRLDSVVLETTDTADFKFTMLTLRSDGEFHFFTLPYGSCFVMQDVRGKWTLEGDQVVLRAENVPYNFQDVFAAFTVIDDRLRWRVAEMDEDNLWARGYYADLLADRDLRPVISAWKP